MKENVIWTIGHSTHTLEEFIIILKSFNIQLVVDIRSLPGSKRYPHFNREFLENSLPEKNIEYIHLGGLGGRRRAKKDSVNLGWRKESFRGYAVYMESEEFKESIHELELLSYQKRTVYMCAEVLWWRCHRSMVSDYLKLNGWKVIHILSAEKSEEHPYTQPARIIDGKLLYTLE